MMDKITEELSRHCK